jgi:hypothetical protein
MADSSREQRLAALKAKRAQATAESGPPEAASPEAARRLATLKAKRAASSGQAETAATPVAPTPAPASVLAATTAPPAEGARSAGLAQKMRKATLTGATRIATAGASIVSFAAMVVAMGPLTGGGGETTTDTAPVDDTIPTTTPPPSQPNVVIEVVPNYVAADGSEAPPDALAAVDETANVGANDELTPAGQTPAAVSAPVQAPTQATPVPTTAPAAVPAAGPAPTAAPATTPPTTAAPATAPPTTVAPLPPPPPTAPPATAPPPPPKSDASG